LSSKEKQELRDSAQGTLKSLSRSQLLVALAFGSLYAPHCCSFHRHSILVDRSYMKYLNFSLLPCFTYMFWNLCLSRLLEASLLSSKIAEATRQDLLVIVKLLILMLQENGFEDSINRPYQRRSAKHNSLGLVGLAAKKSTSMSSNTTQ
jgi:hypothetical protein